MLKNNFFKKSIAARLLRVVFSIYFVVTLVVTLTQLFAEYDRAKSELIETLDEISTSVVPAFSYNLWEMDDLSSQSTLQGVYNYKLIIGAKVTDTTGDVIAAIGKIEDAEGNHVYYDIEGEETSPEKSESIFSQNLISYSQMINFEDPDEDINEKVGDITLYSSEGIVVDKVEYNFIVILITAFFKTLALWMIFLFFAQKLVASPLKGLKDKIKLFGEYINKDEMSKLKDQKLEGSFLKREDELGELAKSYRMMKECIEAKVSDLFILNDSVETIIRSKSKEKIMESFTRSVGSKFPFDNCYVKILPFRHSSLSSGVYVDPSQINEGFEYFKIQLNKEFMVVTEEEYKLAVRDPKIEMKENIYYSESNSNDTHSMLEIILEYDQEALAVLHFIFNNEQKIQLNSENNAFLFSLSKIAGASLHDARLVEVINQYNNELEGIVEERTRILAEKSADMEIIFKSIAQGIFTINKDFGIGREYSLHMHQIFGDNILVESQGVMDLLFENCNLNAEEIDSVEDGIMNIIDFPMLSFDLNRHVLPTELRKFIQGSEKLLELDWQPICDESEKIVKLMVTVRDVTELKRLEKEGEEQKEELKVISEIVNSDPSKFLSFLQNSNEILKDVVEIKNKSKNSFNKETVNQIFILIHTLKGNAKSYNAKKIIQESFEIEKDLASARIGQKELVPNKLWEKLQFLINTVSTYKNIFNNYFSHENEEQNHFKNLVHDRIDDLLDGLDKNSSQEEKLNIIEEMLRIKKEGGLDLHTILQTEIDSMKKVSSELNKIPPEVQVIDTYREFKNFDRHFLVNIFNHLLRNSLAHGFDVGEKGVVWVHVKRESDDEKIVIRYQDSGKGLNLKKLEEKTKELEDESEQSWSDSELAELIFRDGLSTQDYTDDVAGQGVGMPAVRSMIERQGGRITIELNEGQATRESTRFSILIELPLDSALAKSTKAS